MKPANLSHVLQVYITGRDPGRCNLSHTPSSRSVPVAMVRGWAPEPETFLRSSMHMRELISFGLPPAERGPHLR